MSANLISLEGVGRVFDDGAVVALKNTNLGIAGGDCVAILGASGSGKSTLINIMSGIDKPTSGRVCWNDRPVTARRQWAALRRKEIGIIFQEPRLLPCVALLVVDGAAGVLDALPLEAGDEGGANDPQSPGQRVDVLRSSHHQRGE